MSTFADCAPRLSRFRNSPTVFPRRAASGTNSNGHPEEPVVPQDHGLVRGAAAGGVGGHVSVHDLSSPRQLHSARAPAPAHVCEDPCSSIAGGSFDGCVTALGRGVWTPD